MLPDRRPRLCLALMVVAPLSFGCGPSFWMPPPPSPAEIPGLETRVAGDADDVQAAVRLAQAYHAANRPEDARPLLERTVSAHPGQPQAAFLLGVTYEELGLHADARRLYQAYVAQPGASPSLVRELERRLPLIQRRELEAAVRASLAREAELADAAPEPWTVAVFPFEFVGGDPEFRPLGRALAEMFVTDLSQTDRIRVLERLRVQLLLDELALAEEARMDPGTAVRAGRILGVERAVQGSLDGGDPSLRLEAAVVRVREGLWPGEEADPGPTELRRIADEDDLAALFDMQKRVALRIYASLGIELTAAERERVTRRATENLMALLAYGRGLESEDRGDFAGARVHFAQAATLDPAFAEAAAAAARVSAAAEAAGVEPAELAARAESEGSPAGFDESVVPVLIRDPAPEILGTEGLTGRTILELIIRVPGGGP